MTTRDVKFHAGIKVGMIMTKCLIANDLKRYILSFSEITRIIIVNHIKTLANEENQGLKAKSEAPVNKFIINLKKI